MGIARHGLASFTRTLLETSSLSYLPAQLFGNHDHLLFSLVLLYAREVRFYHSLAVLISPFAG